MSALTGNQRPYRATRAELRAIDEAMAEKSAAPARLAQTVLGRFHPKRRIRAQRTALKANPLAPGERRD